MLHFFGTPCISSGILFNSCNPSSIASRKKLTAIFKGCLFTLFTFVLSFTIMSLGKLSKKRYSYGQADRKGGGGGVNPYSQPDRKKTVFFDDRPNFPPENSSFGHFSPTIFLKTLIWALLQLWWSKTWLNQSHRPKYLISMKKSKEISKKKLRNCPLSNAR